MYSMATIMKKKEDIFPFKFENGAYVSYKEKNFLCDSNEKKNKIVFQLFDKNGRALSPEVEDIIYDEKKRVVLYEDRILLDDGKSFSLRFMSDLEGKQIGYVQNDYDSQFEQPILLTGDFEKDRELYECYKIVLQKSIQEKIYKNKENYLELQNHLIHHYFSEKNI